MIARLRKRFVLSAMLAVLAVMAVLMIAINLVNYYSYNRKLDSMLKLISENMGALPDFDKNAPEHELENGDVVTLTPETSFSTRFFVVYYDSNGEIADINLKKVAAVSEKEAAEHAGKVVASNTEFGWCGIYKYYHTKESSKDFIVFLDAENEKSSARSVMFISWAVAILSCGAIFLLVFALSKKALRPVSESFEKQKRFITDAGHELKTPITIISANAQVLELTTGSNEWIDSIKKQTDRMGKLINQMITLSRMSEGIPETSFSKFSLSDAFEEVVSGFEASIVGTGKYLRRHIGEDISIIGAEQEIRMLISILMDNAVKYCDPGGVIEVFLTADKRPVIKIVNSYKNVGKLEFESLFDRFYRADEARTGGNGYGLGLSIAKNITEMHHAQIDAEICGENQIQFIVRF